MKGTLLASTILTVALAGAAAAEMEISAYGGYQTSPHSRVKGTLPAGVTVPGDYSLLIGWDGKSLAMPPYYGARVTWWNSNNSGWGLELSHDKVYAGADMQPNFDRLEFTDGHNIITVNYSKRWPGKWGKLTPHVTAGLGVALPHVDAQPAGGQHTYGYQLTGPALRLSAGASYELTDSWALFGEYQFTASQNEVELTGGGDLSTRILTNAVNIGISYSF